MSMASVRFSCGAALEGRMGQAYNEEAFRYFLTVERKRAASSRRSFLLLLVSIKKRSGVSRPIRPVVATSIFAGLWLGVREVDFIGWFREGRVAGAVLTQGADPIAPDVSRRISQRLTETLRGRVPAHVARRLHVRVLQLRPNQNSSST
jgi:hypothetical protein